MKEYNTWDAPKYIPGMYMCVCMYKHFSKLTCRKRLGVKQKDNRKTTVLADAFRSM